MTNFTYYHNIGVYTVSIKNGTKEPLEKFKTPPVRTPEKLPNLDHLLETGAIGIAVLCGKESNLVAVDIDTDDELVLMAVQKSFSARKGSRGEARFYQWSKDVVPDVFTNEDGEIVVEIKTNSRTGTMMTCHVPPTKHENGKPYEWIPNDILPGEIIPPEELDPLDYDELVKSLKKLGIKSSNSDKKSKKLDDLPTDESQSSDIKQTRAQQDKVYSEGDKEKVREFIKCLPCEVSRQIWRDSGFIARNVLGLEEAKPLFLDTVTRCPEHNSPETIKEAEDILSSTSQAKLGMKKLREMSRSLSIELPEKLFLNIHAVDIAKELIFNRKRFWLYGGLFHFYAKNKWVSVNSIDAIEAVLKEILIEEKLNFIRKEGEAVEVTSLTSRHVCEVRKSMMGILECEQNIKNVLPNSWLHTGEEDLLIIPFVNGLLDIRTGELLPHNGSFTNTAYMPFEYNPNAKCPFWDSVVGNYFEQEYREEHIAELYKVFGYILSKKLHRKKMFCFFGEAGAGKTWLVNVMSWLVGRDYTISSNRQDLTKSAFASGGLDKAKVLFLDDYDFRFITKEASLLKTIVGDAPVKINAKFKDEYSAVPTAVPIFTTNEFPEEVCDAGGGLRDRLIFFRCMKIAKAVPSWEFEQRIKAELPGIFNKALEGARKLLSGEQVKQPPGESDGYRQAFIQSSKDHVERWMEARLLLHSDPEIKPIRIKDMFEDYRLWVEEEVGTLEARNIRSAWSVRTFSSALRKVKMTTGNKWQTMVYIENDSKGYPAYRFVKVTSE